MQIMIVWTTASGATTMLKSRVACVMRGGVDRSKQEGPSLQELPSSPPKMCNCMNHNVCWMISLMVSLRTLINTLFLLYKISSCHLV